MNSSLRIRGTIILLTTLICIYCIVGLPASKQQLMENIGKNIKLGLDLKGGSHLVLQVQVQDAFKAEADLMVDRLKDEMAKRAMVYGTIARNDPDSLESAAQIQLDIKGVAIQNSGDFRAMCTELFPNWVLSTVTSSDFRLNIKPSEALALRADTLERSIRTIENRINGLGVSESVVQQRGRADGDAEILVQLPGVDDPARIKQLLSTTALLELYDVKDGPYPSREEALAQHGGVLPLDSQLLQSRPGSSQGDSWFLVARSPVITGRDLRNARPSQDQFSRWETEFTLRQEAKDRFGRFTEANKGRRLAIVLDKKIFSAPVIESRIEDSGRITGANSQQDASDLALVLRAGSLPAGIKYIEERIVGPSLGSDSIRQGVIAGLVGLLAVVAVMLVYYKKAGVNATVALILNAIILVAVLALIDGVLTLPGIAGIILTIGMAVDSNVLIFERIREELHNGKGVLAAIDAGFSKAMLTIIDTHVTTVVSCAFLFIFGTGPVKGFAVTLTIGLIANFFTAIMVSRFLFDWTLSRQRQTATLSI
jgi:preprotein translocase subunit SecD